MTKTPMGLALVLALSVTGCNQQASAPAEVALDTTEQKISYGFGYSVGESLAGQGLPVDTAAFSEGLRDAVEGAEPRLTQEQLGQEMENYQQELSAEMEETAAAESEANIEAGNAFRADYATAEDVMSTESGLLYRVVTAGEGDKPGAEDVVEVHYRGTLIDGTEFDSSYSRGSPVKFPLNAVIPGWTEGLQLMSPGAKYELVLPPELAYGAGGAGAEIGPNATLVFEVELLSVEPVEAAPEAPAEG